MNTFDQKLKETRKYPLRTDPEKVNVLEVNTGYKCNLRCTHCYVESSPDRTEMMSLETVDKILNILEITDELKVVDITGGAPELNLHYRYFVKSAAAMGKKVMVRTNLAVLTEPALEDMPEFFAKNKIKIIASLPCVTEEGVDRQRGKGTYRKAVAVLKKLNSLGYGKEEPSLALDLVFNPGRAALAPDKGMLEKVYKEKLMEMHGISFNGLIALPNHIIGRLGKSISDEEKKAFQKELEEKFNPDAVGNAMCRFIVNVSWDGKLYDCECAQKFRVPLKSGIAGLDEFDYGVLSNREIATTPTCFICTAGAGTT